ncbi:MAG: OsmC family protein [Flavobacteriales bacterium]|nr:OsmC family protein [Flavobacteriales bacterium]
MDKGRPTSIVVYEGELSTGASHVQSGTVIRTDAPKDNQGLGRAFSPTDLLATALGSCMLTIMGIRARTAGHDINGTTAKVTKVMGEQPRRVAEVIIEMEVMDRDLAEKDRQALEHAALNCPVAKSLSEHLKQTVRFSYLKA